MATTPTQRTIKALRDQGMTCGIVEKFNPHVGPHGIRQDLFGFIDIIALDVEQIVAIQSCGQSFSEHLKKIVNECGEVAEQWIASGGRIELWGWRKVKLKRGGKAMRWKPRVKVITQETLRGVQESA